MMGLLMALGKRAQYALRDLSLESWSGENALPAFRLYIGALPGLREDPRREDFPMLLLRLLDFSDGISGEEGRRTALGRHGPHPLRRVVGRRR